MEIASRISTLESELEETESRAESAEEWVFISFKSIVLVATQNINLTYTLLFSELQASQNSGGWS